MSWNVLSDRVWVWCCPRALAQLCLGDCGASGSAVPTPAAPALQPAAPGHRWGDASPRGKAEAVRWGSPPDLSSWAGLCGGQGDPHTAPWAVAVQPVPAAAARESLEALEKVELQRETNWEGEASRKLRLRGARAGRALLPREPVLFLAARKRPVGRVWRGADPQAHPRSAIDCSAFPINYSLIMENRLRWLRGSGSSSHVAVAGEGAGQPCPHPSACLPAAARSPGGAACSPPLARRSAELPGRAGARQRGREGPLRCTGLGARCGDGSPGMCVVVRGATPAPVREGSLFLPRGQLAAC